MQGPAQDGAKKPSRYATPVMIHEGIAYLSGQLPRRNGEVIHRGRVGAEIDVAAAREAARVCAETCVALLEGAVGGREGIVKIIKITGFVASAPGFNDQPEVIDAASEVLLDLLGTAGAHARSAVGVAELPHRAPVEIELIAAVRMDRPQASIV